VGIGWNLVEYKALSEDFSTRGARIEEQIEEMHLLQTQEVVSYEEYHLIDAVVNWTIHPATFVV